MSLPPAEGSIYASPIPESESGYDLATQDVVEKFISQIASGQSTSPRHIQPFDEDHEQSNLKPDHPCNYCHKFHFFSGPGATPCPVGTRLPDRSRHTHGHNRKGKRRHLPNAHCSKCGQKHWVAGPDATPCASPFTLQGRSSRSGSSQSSRMPATQCRRCGSMHWFSGPLAVSCARNKMRTRTKVRAITDRDTISTVEPLDTMSIPIKAEEEAYGSTYDPTEFSNTSPRSQITHHDVDGSRTPAEGSAYDPYPRRSSGPNGGRA